MLTINKPQQGRLIDLGPDGLGFIIPADNPGGKLAFSLRLLQLPSFAKLGLREGAQVEYRLNEKRQIESIRPIIAE